MGGSRRRHTSLWVFKDVFSRSPPFSSFRRQGSVFFLLLWEYLLDWYNTGTVFFFLKCLNTYRVFFFFLTPTTRFSAGGWCASSTVCSPPGLFFSFQAIVFFFFFCVCFCFISSVFLQHLQRLVDSLVLLLLSPFYATLHAWEAAAGPALSGIGERSCNTKQLGGLCSTQQGGVSPLSSHLTHLLPVYVSSQFAAPLCRFFFFFFLAFAASGEASARGC